MKPQEIQRDGWISIPAVLVQESGVLRLREPATADRQRLIHQLQDNIYPRPFVLDDGEVRRLQFSLKLVQSEMRIADPTALALAYTRAMTGFLLFHPNPRHLVIVGLGGGSLAKWCHRHLARSRITALEYSADVIACRDWFALPPDDERLQVIEAEAAGWFTQHAGDTRADVILLDAYDEDGLAPQLCTEPFYVDLRAALKPDGVLVANISGYGPLTETHIALMQRVFNDRVVVIDVSSEGNRIAYAFNNPAHPPAWGSLLRPAKALDERHDLDLATLLRDMEKSARRQKRKSR
ncbi:spermidine synthase-like protein [Viridibacterium curvum]|uniref:Fused MFS/spermidine synthase n=1 Tax=Viridibacterium curvum TaxID=1101404 RepID=A0ABP9QE04_9RHOO